MNYRQSVLRIKVVQSGSAFSDYGDVTAQQFTYNGRVEHTGAIGYLGSDITLPAMRPAPPESGSAVSETGIVLFSVDTYWFRALVVLSSRT